jgi:L-ascorbate metabolism protein UlaG (beta-lactamase superfamily)
MRRLLAALLASTVVAGAAPAQDKKFTVTWYGQSFFTVATPQGKVIAFDPQVMHEFERKDPVKADFVCVSHPHDDHNRVEEGIADGKDAKKVKVFQGLNADPTRPNRPADWNKIDQKVKVGDAEYRFRTFGCYHDTMGGMKAGKNAAFIVEADGLTFCHLGDLGHTFTEAEAKVIGKVDVLFVPIGGNYTLNGEMAREVIEVLKPRLFVVPMHYAVDGQPDTLIGPDEFVDGIKNLKRAEGTNELVIPAGTKADEPTTVLLGWKKGEKKDK